MGFASSILMVRPAAFGFNTQTAADNAFQQNKITHDAATQALREFDAMVAALEKAGVQVTVIHDTPHPPKPDAIFPNNWFCTMPDGSLHTFPMYAPNRRIERNTALLQLLQSQYSITACTDWSHYEQEGRYLEGTGSMVMDHDHQLIFAALSQRTNQVLLQAFAQAVGYKPLSFRAADKNGLPIYHTNVLMCIGNGFCLLCEEVIESEGRQKLLQVLEQCERKPIAISFTQMKQFAGNMLQLQSADGNKVLVMSATAFNSLDPGQKAALERFTSLLPVKIDVIETIGGGSARCMMAEIFAPPQMKA